MLDLLYSIIIYGLISIYLIYKLEKLKVKMNLIVPFMLCLSLHFIVIVILKVLFNFSFGDETVYELYGKTMTEAWINYDFIISSVSIHAGYYILNAIIFLFFGVHPIILCELNIIFYILAILDFNSIIKFLDYKNKRFIFFINLFLLFAPTMFLWSSISYKEALTIYLIVKILKISICGNLNKKGMLQIIKVLILIGILIMIRVPSGLFIAVAYALFMLTNKNIQKVGKLTLSFVFLLCGIILLIVLQKKGLFGLISLSSFNNARLGYAGDNTAMFSNLVFSSYSDVIKFLPKGLVYFLFAPFPWMVSNMNTLMAIPENLIFSSFLILYSIKGIKNIYRRDSSILILCLAFILQITLISAISYFNVGLGYRIKWEIIIPLFILIVAGNNYNYEKKQKLMLNSEV